MATPRQLHMNVASMGVQPMMGAVAAELVRIPLQTYGTCSACGDLRAVCCTKAHATLCCACECATNPPPESRHETVFGDDEVTYEDGRLCLGCDRWFPVTSRFWYMRDDYKKDRGVRPYGKCKECRYDAEVARVRARREERT